jgi:hypothetical protein
VSLWLLPFLFAQSPDIILSRILGNTKLAQAREFIASNLDRLLQDPVVGDEIRQGQQDGPLIAIVASSQGVTAMGAIKQAMTSAGITTKIGLLFVAINTADEMRDFLETGPYHDRIRSVVVLQPSPENNVFGPDKAIGSTIVQYGLQSVSANGGEPMYQAANEILAVPIRLHIPSVGLGIGENSSPTTRGLQTALTAILAIAGM